MLGALVERQILAAERETGESAQWMRDLYRASPSAMVKFSLFMPLSRHRKAASAEQHAVARLVATKTEDCGPCVQTIVNLSLKAGVDPAILRAVLDERVEDLPADLKSVYGFAYAVATAAPDASGRVERLKLELGEDATAELALAVATTRVFPTVKRGLGYGVSCSRVTIGVGAGGG